MAYLFISLRVTFDDQKFLILMKSISFSFVVIAFCVQSKKFCLIPSHEDIFMFSSKSFMILAFTFRLVIHLKFCVCCELRVRIHFFPYEYSVISA